MTTAVSNASHQFCRWIQL